MALNVISNFAANVAHRNLVVSDAAASASLTKLSSGQRVVSAKDDAASLAIGSRLRAEVVAMKTASVNAGQASSMLQIADGAMATIADILVRMKELAVQSSSGQFSSVERGVLDSEFQALKSEITRISNDTEFNGTQLIAGGNAVYSSSSRSATTNELNGDAAPGITVTFTDTSFDTTLVNDEDTFRFSYVYTSSTVAKLTLTNTNTGDRQTIDIAATLNAAGGGSGANLVLGESATINFANLGVKVVINENFVRTSSIDTESAQDRSGTISGGFDTAGTLDVTYSTSSITNADLTLLLASTDYNASTGLLTINTSGAANVLNILSTGITFSVDGDTRTVDGNSADLDDGLTHTIEIFLGAAGAKIATVATSADLNGDGNAGAFTIDIGELFFGVDFTTTGTTTSFDFKVGTGNQTYDNLTFTIDSASATALSISGNNILTAPAAELASTAVSTAIDTLNTSRSTVGAAQNRLTFAAQNLASAIENAEAARSTLLDLDVASEITVFTSKQVLLQTGIAMLAQANQLPQNLLRLFQ